MAWRLNLSLFEYGEDSVRTTTNRNGDVSTRIFNENGLLTKYIDENGSEKIYSYDASNITEEIDGR